MAAPNWYKTLWKQAQKRFKKLWRFIWPDSSSKPSKLQTFLSFIPIFRRKEDANVTIDTIPPGTFLSPERKKVRKDETQSLPSSPITPQVQTKKTKPELISAAVTILQKLKTAGDEETKKFKHLLTTVYSKDDLRLANEQLKKTEQNVNEKPKKKTTLRPILKQKNEGKEDESSTPTLNALDIQITKLNSNLNRTDKNLGWMENTLKVISKRRVSGDKENLSSNIQNQTLTEEIKVKRAQQRNWVIKKPLRV